jgi:hypothetical protein
MPEPLPVSLSFSSWVLVIMVRLLLYLLLSMPLRRSVPEDWPKFNGRNLEVVAIGIFAPGFRGLLYPVNWYCSLFFSSIASAPEFGQHSCRWCMSYVWRSEPSGTSGVKRFSFSCWLMKNLFESKLLYSTKPSEQCPVVIARISG